MDKKKKNEKLLDILGAACGCVLLVILVANIILGNRVTTAGANAADIPADAMTLTGVAAGRNGDVKVEIVATADKLYQIRVTEQGETDGIGTVAVDELPGRIYEAQSLDVDSVSGATITSTAIKAAIRDALASGGLDASAFGMEPGVASAPTAIAKKVETHSGVTVLHASDWAEQYPDIYESWTMTRNSDEIVDYLEQYPMLPTLYEPYGFAYSYGSARGHFYDVTDIEETGRPHALANCWTCKTPDFTNMVNEMGDEAYQLVWTDVQQQIVEGISCYNCHANTPGEITITHTYWIDAVGDDFDSIAPANLACGQCHNEYYFDPVTKATKIAHHDLESMAPDAILAYFNDASNFADGQIFTDYTNPRTGVKQIKVQHPEFETFLGAGSQHARDFTCADCHMPDAVNAEGVSYRSHELMSPLDNPELIANNCSSCHADLVSEVHAVQEKVEARTYSVGYELEFLTELLADAVESGEYTEEQLNEVRSLARDAQFYWDFVFVENAEGAHNPTLTYDCLDKAEALTNQAIALLR
ncbi:MAG: ammonia-forming cytochrome c nitrite reductase subunit c552 [Oscillospiraceae bacterium]|nr:ammonia-forming cytochrome c nitrite reductase subunit c552 [Oscillospiraceae bacterium]